MSCDDYAPLLELFAVSQSDTALQQLDETLRQHAQKKQVGCIVQILEALVEHYPQNKALRARLAAIYRVIGRQKAAVDLLETLE
jgi:thioredoxin-like negative regulator of GroEL